MKALVLDEYLVLNYREVPDLPSPGAKEVRVKIHAAAICGSDIHGMDGSTGRRRPPVIMGHEASGSIVETGREAGRFKIGDRVTFDSTIWCGECFHCRRGEVNLCDDRKVLGVSCQDYRRDGAFADYLVIPERILFPIPESLSHAEAALAEPAAVAAHAISITPVRPGDNSIVVGSGLIGLLLIQMLRATGCGRIVAIDPDHCRREKALGFGADAAFDPNDPEFSARALSIFSGRGADRAFEAVGASLPIQTAIQLVRKGGSVTLVGNLSPQVELPLQSIVTRQISLFGSCALAGEYPLVLDLMARGKLDAKSLISAIAPLSEGAVWFERLKNRGNGLMKVVLEP